MKKTLFALIVGISVFATVGLAQEKLTPELWRRIDSEGPKPLPQSPAVKRDTTDAEDDGLKGKVKRVIREYRTYTDVCAKRGRLLGDIDDFDQNGNQLRNVAFANCGQLVGITVYGFIDGFRASLDKRVSSAGSGRVTVLRSAPPQPNPPTQKRDERYTYKFEYSYTAGKPTVMRMFHNDGRRGMYYKYSGSPTEKSTSAFTADDEHNWRMVYKLDDQGNEIEQISVDVRKVYGKDIVYRIQNKAFDQAGNWIQRSKYEIQSENGKTSEILISDEFRTIIYH
ncbi:MAG TPA: hypothetical protein PKE66_04670 [Pyrinomonadaceae bacterium]|nr:hypothetical protein [Pyrinomonadaceae bacterium]